MTEEPLGELDRVTREQNRRRMDDAALNELIGEVTEEEKRLLRLDAQRRASGHGKLPQSSIPPHIQPAVRKILEED